jgi:hypothetical protein
MEDGPLPPSLIALHTALVSGGPPRLPLGGAANATGDASGEARHGDRAHTREGGWTRHHEEEGRSKGRWWQGAS